MNNNQISAIFLARKVPSASNGRRTMHFKDGVLHSYDEVIAAWIDDTLLVTADVLSPVSSRHQREIKEIAGHGNFVLVPVLTDLVGIRTIDDFNAYFLQRQVAIGDLERRLAATRSPNNVAVINNRIAIHRSAITIALKRLPFHEAVTLNLQHRLIVPVNTPNSAGHDRAV